MTRKSITTSHAAVACDVCGRTLLRGENADTFIAGGSRRMVCELCTARAANEGWIREGADNNLSARRNGTRGGRSLLGRLRQRRDGAPRRPPYEDAPPPGYGEPATGGAPSAADTVYDPAEPGYAAYDPGSEAAWGEAAGAAGSSGGARAEVAGSGEAAPTAPRRPAEPAFEPLREPRHVRAVPTNADLKMARALDVFNASDHPRTVSGVARSLGAPAVTVLPSAVEGAIVSIVVGWELCWYRYEVDLADEAAGVRVTGQGAELTELEPEEQMPNAAADDRGALTLAG